MSKYDYKKHKTINRLSPNPITIDALAPRDRNEVVERMLAYTVQSYIREDLESRFSRLIGTPSDAAETVMLAAVNSMQLRMQSQGINVIANANIRNGTVYIDATVPMMIDNINMEFNLGE